MEVRHQLQVNVNERYFSVPNGWEAEWATNLWCQNEHVIKAARSLTIAKRTGEVHEPRLPLPCKGTHTGIETNFYSSLTKSCAWEDEGLEVSREKQIALRPV
jgi:hypothetical protein